MRETNLDSEADRLGRGLDQGERPHRPSWQIDAFVAHAWRETMAAEGWTYEALLNKDSTAPRETKTAGRRSQKKHGLDLRRLR